MRSPKTLNYLTVLSALAWAAMPTWGAAALLATLVLLFIASVRIVRVARATLEPFIDKLGVDDPAGRDFLRRYAINLLWPDSAQRWASSWQILGPLALFLALVFIGRALIGFDWWPLPLLAPVTVVFFLGGGGARFFDMQDRLDDDLAHGKAAWVAANTRLDLRRTLGDWPPVPPPDEEEPSPAPPPETP